MSTELVHVGVLMGAFVSKALRAARARFGDRHNYSMGAMRILAAALRYEKKPDEALQTIDQLIALQRQFPKPPIEMVQTLQIRAALLGAQPGRPGEQEAWRESYEVAKLYLPDDQLRCSSVYSNYLISRLRDAKDKTAIPEVEDVANHCKPLSPVDALSFSMSLAEAYRLAGLLDCAEAAAREALARAHFFKRGDAWICWAENELAFILLARHRLLDEAEQLFRVTRGIPSGVWPQRQHQSGED